MPEKDKPVEVAPDAGGEKDGVITEAAPPSAEPDWKELLRLERQRTEKVEQDRDNYREGMLSYKEQLKARRNEVTDSDEGDEKIAKAVEKVIAPIAEALQGNKIDQILGSLVTDPSKREYVKSLYQSRIQRTGTSDDAIRQDLQAALTLADGTRFAKENEELRRMNDNKTYVPPNMGGGSQDKGAPQHVHKWTPEQEATLEMRARANGIADVAKYKDLAWKAAQEGSAFEIKKQYIK